MRSYSLTPAPIFNPPSREERSPSTEAHEVALIALEFFCSLPRLAAPGLTSSEAAHEAYFNKLDPFLIPLYACERAAGRQIPAHSPYQAFILASDLFYRPEFFASLSLTSQSRALPSFGNLREKDLISPHDWFRIHIYLKAKDDPQTDGDRLAGEYRQWIAGKDDFKNAPVPLEQALLHVMDIIIAYIVQAERAEESGRPELACSYACDAWVWADILRSAWRTTPSDRDAEFVKWHEKHVALGKRGAEKRHAPMKALQEWTLNLYEEHFSDNKTLSANKAAHALEEKVIAQSRTTGVNLSSQNAQRTIAQWIRKFKKSA